jgi:tRNA pseudouridine38-40 synthase
MHTRNLKLTLEYDGTDFAGWQVQPGERTVQGVLEAAFSDLAGEPVAVTGSGRTDAGVHALGQVASVETRLALAPPVVAAALNDRLPDDLLVRSVEDAAPGFHARYSAAARRYLYLIGATPSPLWRRRRWLVTYDLDVPRMAEAALALRGERDFSSFALSGSEPNHHRCRVSLVSLEWDPRHGGMVVFRIEADRFLRGMVRSIVGTLVEVGRGKTAPEDIPAVLDALDRSAAGPTAPPWGLYLEQVTYGEEVSS